MTDMKENGEKNRLLMRKSTPIILLGVVVMAGLTAYVISQNPSLKEAFDAERPAARETVMSLSVHEYGDENSIDVTSATNNMKLAFDLSSNVPVHIALLASLNGLAPKILLQDARIPPGQHKHIEMGGNMYIYRTVPNEGNIEFCLVQASSAPELSRKLLRPKTIWLRIPKKQCVQVEA